MPDTDHRYRFMRACNARGEILDLREIRRQKSEQFYVVVDSSKKVSGTQGPTKSNHSSKSAAEKAATKNHHFQVFQAKHKLDLGLHYNPLLHGTQSHSKNWG
jgi:hypothetical protein